ncbi:hypothetical protein ACIP2X_37100 [Streptomyces sp. NPDC089424]|uniref:hypothetical protein n=1 Tax=Streptomyces sp. NPDC089424 TaxID=3365917 RepID=UPI0038275D1E
MSWIKPAATVLLLTVEELAQWRYGTTGLVALVLLLIGLHRRNHTCSAIGAVALSLSVTGPAL